MTDRPAAPAPPTSATLVLLAWLGLALALGGTVLALGGTVLALDALVSVVRGGGLWLACTQTQGLAACSDTLSDVLVTRAGLNAVAAISGGGLALALGPVPGVLALLRRRERWAAALLLLLVLGAYGLLGLLVLLAGLLAASYVLLPVLL